MIGITKITGGRFGNRILHYNNLVQLSLEYNIPAYCSHWEGHQYFESLIESACSDNRPPSEITWREIVEGRHVDMLTQGLHCVVDGGLIHNFYYDISRVQPRTFMKLRSEFIPKFNPNTKNLGIHIRGGDIISADGNNGREVHSFEYYRDAMDLLKSKENFDSVHICTDDTSFLLFQRVTAYANDLFGNKNVFIGPATNSTQFSHIYDFGVLTECEYLISSSSTYAICAGFLGKEKKIIHSKDWIDKNIPGEKRVSWGHYSSNYPKTYWDQYDKFWQQVYTLNSELYRACEFI